MPVEVGKTIGRDALIGVPAETMAVHLHVFFVADRQYQIMAQGLAEQKAAKNNCIPEIIQTREMMTGALADELYQRRPNSLSMSVSFSST